MAINVVTQTLVDAPAVIGARLVYWDATKTMDPRRSGQSAPSVYVAPTIVYLHENPDKTFRDPIRDAEAIARNPNNLVVTTVSAKGSTDKLPLPTMDELRETPRFLDFDVFGSFIVLPDTHANVDTNQVRGVLNIGVTHTLPLIKKQLIELAAAQGYQMRDPVSAKHGRQALEFFKPERRDLTAQRMTGMTVQAG